jgi:hypothetical protein
MGKFEFDRKNLIIEILINLLNHNAKDDCQQRTNLPIFGDHEGIAQEEDGLRKQQKQMHVPTRMVNKKEEGQHHDMI